MADAVIVATARAAAQLAWATKSWPGAPTEDVLKFAEGVVGNLAPKYPEKPAYVKLVTAAILSLLTVEPEAAVFGQAEHSFGPAIGGSGDVWCFDAARDELKRQLAIPVAIPV